MKKKSKYNRRRAVRCRIIEQSKTHKGYCKYLVTIAEKDGTYHKEPAYGRDMQDAISRLMWAERTHKVEKKLNSTVLALLIVTVLGFTSFLTSKTDQPLYLLVPFASIVLLYGGSFVWYKYIEKYTEH